MKTDMCPANDKNVATHCLEFATQTDGAFALVNPYKRWLATMNRDDCPHTKTSLNEYAIMYNGKVNRTTRIVPESTLRLVNVSIGIHSVVTVSALVARTMPGSSVNACLSYRQGQHVCDYVTYVLYHVCD